MIRGRRCVLYAGASMNPTLREPDLLWVEPYGAGQVRPGDVVCFKSIEYGRTVVHRVTSVKPDSGQPMDGRPSYGIRTRGDNSPKDDLWILQPGDIIGRVRAAQRGARRREIRGGWRGLAALRWARLCQRVCTYGEAVAHELYRIFAGLGPFDRLLPLTRRPRAVRFATSSQTYLKLLMGKRPVGQFDVQLRTWHVRPPFSLFVDEHSLPDPSSMPPVPRARTPNPPYQ